MAKEVEIQVKREGDLDLPFYTTEGASGADVVAAIEGEISLEPGHSLLVPTGLILSIPQDYEIQIRPRSGLALKHGITVLNTPGTIDSDYRGEVKVILINHGKEPFILKRGMRIAQFVLCPVVKAKYIPTQTLKETERGEGGFGHSGLNSKSRKSP